MENAVTPCPFPEQMKEEDRAVFERVWRRVMPEERADCPVTVAPLPALLPAGDLPCPCTVSPLPAGREGPSTHRGSDFPEGADIPCLGPSSAVYGSQLQRQTKDAVECWQCYRQLSRRAGNAPCARLLSALAAEKQRTAKRLAAAYFLISGVRWWPERQEAAPPTSFHGALRQHYGKEQQRALAYDAAGEDTSDEALAALYRELAIQSRDHAAALRAMLEQMQ